MATQILTKMFEVYLRIRRGQDYPQYGWGAASPPLLLYPEKIEAICTSYDYSF